jgi:hypothetical protein
MSNEVAAAEEGGGEEMSTGRTRSHYSALVPAPEGAYYIPYPRTVSEHDATPTDIWWEPVVAFAIVDDEVVPIVRDAGCPLSPPDCDSDEMFTGDERQDPAVRMRVCWRSSPR